MENATLIEFIDFFNALSIEENDVTTNEERVNGQLVLVVTYNYNGQSFTTDKLYYKDISNLSNVKRKREIIKYFDAPVFWLDNEVHDWPQGSGDSNLESIVIPEIIVNGDNKFREFLLTLANNHQKGKIQQITAEGRSAQYYHNLENNNHWHDLVNLIKAYINSNGAEIDKRYFSRLVFKWDGNKNTKRERSTLSNKVYWCSRSLVTKLEENIKNIQPEIMKKEIVDLLLQKKQIVLQGPPGTGKTRFAKILAKDILSKEVRALVDDQFIASHIVKGLTINSPENSNTFAIISNINPAIRILPKGAESERTVNYTHIKNCCLNWNDDRLVSEFTEGGQGSYVVGITKYLLEKVSEPYIKLVQFHPSYGYEDFVRGISAKSNDGDVTYSTVNRLLGDLADVAWRNYESGAIKYNYVLIIDEINRANLPSVLGELIYALEYRGEKVKSLYTLDGGTNDLIMPPNLYIIGTMNTADRSVGHIDYAIRRRFAFVDIGVDFAPIQKIGDAKIMNLFKDVAKLFWKEFIETPGAKMERSNFLASDFKPEDVMIGHSYFLAKNEAGMKQKLKYEIQPILKEYLKDGILTTDAEPLIEKLGV